MANDLFERLQRYGSTRERNQTENFFTELVAYLLRTEPIAREEFVRLVAGDWGKNLCDGEVRVETQVVTESANTNLNGLRLDLLLTCGNSELIVENKVGDELGETQLRNYLSYARELQREARVAVVSRQHNPALDGIKGDANWTKEALWWEVADLWAKRKKVFSCPQFIEEVLGFMTHHHMGPIEPFAREEMEAPTLWRGFATKKEEILIRLDKQVLGPAWPEDCDLERWGLYPDNEKALDYQGLLWVKRGVAPYRPECTFWYFIGFRYGELFWHPPLLEHAQPECAVIVGVWGEGRMRAHLNNEVQRLNTNLCEPHFQVVDSDNGEGIFLCRRRKLGDFLKREDQTLAILGFLEESHRIVESAVPRIRGQHREFLNGAR